jgi:hypothetical protein
MFLANALPTGLAIRSRLVGFVVETVLLISLGFLADSPLLGQQGMVRISTKGKQLTGQALAFDGANLVLMRRDGRISILPAMTKDIQPVAAEFKPYSLETVRTQLQKEFGSKYQVSTTRNFVVVHPPGDYQDWAMPFETLFQRFHVYFDSRGFALDRPQFPLMAVVLRKRSEFDKFLQTYYEPADNMLGYYSQKSNRIITYDPSGGRGAKSDWAFNETLIHEAVHQTAFNVGIHKRFGYSPKWVVEGLACMFEAKGVHSSNYFSNQRDRINDVRLANLKYFYGKDQVQGRLIEMLETDKVFERDPMFAYAYSWGLTFFLAENFPGKFFSFLRADAGRKEFQEYSARQRLVAFKQAFGKDLLDLEHRMREFILKLDL